MVASFFVSKFILYPYGTNCNLYNLINYFWGMAMTDEEILALLKKMIEENDDFEEKDITFFEIIDKSDKETLISRMLAYTLKKDEGLAGRW